MGFGAHKASQSPKRTSSRTPTSRGARTAALVHGFCCKHEVVSQHPASCVRQCVAYRVSSAQDSDFKDRQPSSCEKATDVIQLLQDVALCLDIVQGRLGRAVEEERHDQGDEGCSDGDGADVSPRRSVRNDLGVQDRGDVRDHGRADGCQVVSTLGQRHQLGGASDNRDLIDASAYSRDGHAACCAGG